MLLVQEVQIALLKRVCSLGRPSVISQGGIGYAKTVLEKALGKEHAQAIINRLTSSLQVRPFDFARKADPSQILNFIQNEHPQTIALILSYLEAEQAGGTGEVIEPDDGVLAIGSGGNYALAAGRALKKYSGHSLTAEEIAKAALQTAAEICVYTNDQIIVEVLEWLRDKS